jgi:hypothetical protein
MLAANPAGQKKTWTSACIWNYIMKLVCVQKSIKILCSMACLYAIFHTNRYISFSTTWYNIKDWEIKKKNIAERHQTKFHHEKIFDIFDPEWSNIFSVSCCCPKCRTLKHTIFVSKHKLFFCKQTTLSLIIQNLSPKNAITLEMWLWYVSMSVKFQPLS